MDTSYLQNSLKTGFTYKGTALHSGIEARMVCLPAPCGHGIVFSRLDLPGQPSVRATPGNVISTRRSTSLGLDGRIIVSGIEHLMAAFCITGIDNAMVELDSGELPAGDGSAMVFTELIRKSGVEAAQSAPGIQSYKGIYFIVDKSIYLNAGDSYIFAAPCDEFRLSYILEYPSGIIGKDYLDCTFDKHFFESEIAPARTFALDTEIDALRKEGLALGGSNENALLFSEKGASSQLRFADEPVRHKVLDLLGDLFLLGRIKGHIVGVKSGHDLNVRLATALTLADMEVRNE